MLWYDLPVCFWKLFPSSQLFVVSSGVRVVVVVVFEVGRGCYIIQMRDTWTSFGCVHCLWTHYSGKFLPLARLRFTPLAQLRESDIRVSCLYSVVLDQVTEAVTTHIWIHVTEGCLSLLKIWHVNCYFYAKRSTSAWLETASTSSTLMFVLWFYK